jgi:tetratricopeptide (TPR) repeat protein
MKKIYLYIIVASILILGILYWLLFAKNDSKDEYSKTFQQKGINSELVISYPANNTIFPPDIASPTILWQDSDSDMDEWLAIVESEGKIAYISDFIKESKWKPDSTSWEQIKNSGYGKNISINIVSVNQKKPGIIYNGGKVTINISKDSVSAPIFFRAVPLPFGFAVDNLSTISWRLGNVSNYTQPKILLTNFPVCGNCHSFSSDAKKMSMDIDYANDKGSYFISPLTKNTDVTFDKIITWSDYKREEGELTFGLLSQISPDGKYVLSTVKDRSIFVRIDKLDYSQLFFPVKGIIGVYNTETKKFSSLPGADDKNICNSNPIWSPDGKTVLFTKSPLHQIPNADKFKEAILPIELAQDFIDGKKDYKYDIYKIDFNDGNGGVATPLQGASGNGMSNFFPKYSPDGKWIVYCQTKNFMLLQPDAKLYIIPSGGGTPRLMNCNNLGTMNSWHSWSPNGKWMVFSSKARGPYTQLYLTHIDENGNDSPPVILENMLIRNRAANIPEFLNTKYDDFDKITEKFIDNDNYAIARGNEKVKLGDFKGALVELNKAIELNPKDEVAYTRRGVVNFELGFLLEAIKDFNKVIELKPESFFAYHNRAALKVKTKDFAGAIKDYDMAIKLNPKSSEEYYQRGEAKFNMNLFKESISDFDYALKLNPKNDSYYILRASAYYNIKDFKSSLNDFNEAIKIKTTDGNYFFKRAITKLQLDMNDSALQDLKEAERLGNKEASEYIMNFFEK